MDQESVVVVVVVFVFCIFLILDHRVFHCQEEIPDGRIDRSAGDN